METHVSHNHTDGTLRILKFLLSLSILAYVRKFSHMAGMRILPDLLRRFPMYMAYVHREYCVHVHCVHVVCAFI